ncbi:unnamed protein product [Amoebophrya sp. A25]|nr:unnamed protein product [Amoebophrya sp. A25]|eukprot:GSA25T00012222001.1
MRPTPTRDERVDLNLQPAMKPAVTSSIDPTSRTTRPVSAAFVKKSHANKVEDSNSISSSSGSESSESSPSSSTSSEPSSFSSSSPASSSSASASPGSPLPKMKKSPNASTAGQHSSNKKKLRDEQEQHLQQKERNQQVSSLLIRSGQINGAINYMERGRNGEVPPYTLEDESKVQKEPISDRARKSPSAGHRRGASRGGVSKAAQREMVKSGASDITSAKKSIVREVEILRRCSHPNVVRFYDSFVQDDNLIIVMDYHPGVTLLQYLSFYKIKRAAFEQEPNTNNLMARKTRRNNELRTRRENPEPTCAAQDSAPETDTPFTFPSTQRWKIFCQVCLALRYLHCKLKIAHCDLSPNNVLVTPHTLHCKLIDFGLARDFGDEKSERVDLTCRGKDMMKHGAAISANENVPNEGDIVFGSVLYSTPETLQGHGMHRPWDGDIWAAGCLLYKLCMFNDAFAANFNDAAATGNPLAIARRIVELDYQPLDATSLTHEESDCTLEMDVLSTIFVPEPSSRPDIQTLTQMLASKLCDLLEEAN